MNHELRIVSLENYYVNIHRKEAREYFLEMTALRAGSYGPDYPNHYLPLDQSDCIAPITFFFGIWESGRSLEGSGT